MVTDSSTPLKPENALECHGLTKQFGGLEAVKQVTLSVKAGERRAIIGPNGAGKTTFFSLISGELSATAGIIKLFGRNVTHLSSYRRTHLGLGRTFQITNLFNTMTVLDNLVVAAMGLWRMKLSMWRSISAYRGLYERAEEVLTSIHMFEKRHEMIKNLSHGEQRQIEISLALISKPRVLLLDEPTAGLSPAESGMMTTVIRKLDPTITILIIEHNMDVAFQVAERISVFHQGCLFTEGSQAEIRGDPRVQEIYFGTENRAC
jgi:branched-chain amino acid transport system ATP-binding protein